MLEDLDDICSLRRALQSLYLHSCRLFKSLRNLDSPCLKIFGEFALSSALSYTAIVSVCAGPGASVGTVQNQTVDDHIGNFKWTIPDFKKITGRKYYSYPFVVGGCNWYGCRELESFVVVKHAVNYWFLSVEQLLSNQGVAGVWLQATAIISKREQRGPTFIVFRCCGP